MSDLRALVGQLVATDSVNPTLVPGGAGEAEIGRLAAGWLAERDVAVEVDELAPARVNVIGRVHGSGGGRTMLLNGHLDTVALGGADAGLAPRIEGDRLFGRGAYDMKGSLAALMSVTAAAVELELRGDVILTLVADEEALSIGSERIAETVEADAAIVAEPTELRIAIAHRGFVWLEVETLGRAAHGSRYDLGVDAITAMGPVLSAIAELDARLDLDGPRHPLLGRGSLHASLIEGGTELSTYPDRCVVKVERRTLPGETVASVEVELQALAGGASVRSFFSREPLETPRDAPVVELLAKHGAGEIVGMPFWTDAALLAAAGIPTVLFGPGGEGAHADVEWVDLDDVEEAVRVLLATVREFCA